MRADHLTSRRREALWDTGARGDPLPVGLKRNSELVVIHSQVPVSPAHNSFGHDLLHFLRQYTDIDPVGTIVGKPIEPKAVVEATEKNDIVFERNIGPATAAPAAKTSSASATNAAARCCKTMNSARTTSNT